MQTNSTQTFCVTPKGRGAIATVVVQGVESLHVIDKCFRSVSGKLISESSIGQILFGRWNAVSNGTDVGEDLVVCRTDTQTAEIHCHGGLIAPNNIVRQLVSLGCSPAEPRVLNCPSKIKSDALHALSNAPTERTALILLEQSYGLLEDEIRRIAKLTIEDATNARQRISDLLATAQFGIHLHEYWNVVFAGPPNVGKSSLMNVLAGFKRSIVYDQPGTTRDLISIDTAFDGWPVRLTDTAGIHDSPVELETQGIELAKRRANEADLVIHVSDATNDTSVTQHSLAPRQIYLKNKCDLLAKPPLPTAPCIYTSALTQMGMKELVDRIVKCIVPIEFSSKVPIVFTRQQESQLKLALSNLEADACDRAKTNLEAML